MSRPPKRLDRRGDRARRWPSRVVASPVHDRDVGGPAARPHLSGVVLEHGRPGRPQRGRRRRPPGRCRSRRRRPGRACRRASQSSGPRRRGTRTGCRPSPRTSSSFCQVSASSSSGSQRDPLPGARRLDQQPRRRCGSRPGPDVGSRRYSLATVASSAVRARRASSPRPPGSQEDRQVLGPQHGLVDADRAAGEHSRRRHVGASRRSRSSRPAETSDGSRTSPRLRNSSTADSTMSSSSVPSVGECADVGEVVAQARRRVLGPRVLGGEARDAAAQRVLVLVEVRHARARCRSRRRSAVVTRTGMR